MFSGGVGSWAAAKRVAERHGTDNLVLLFTDTKMEDEDLYRFLEEAAANVGGTLVRIAEGRTPWEVFFDVRFLGNSRVDPCSRTLKREQSEAWLEANCLPYCTRIYVGIDWSEKHRIDRLAELRKPWVYEAPMCDPPYMSKPPWPTAARMLTVNDDGLLQQWRGVVWCNPPYDRNVIGEWLARLAHHDNGMALIFARTETEWFHQHVWAKADAIYFLAGRINFYTPQGVRASYNSGAPSCLVAYGETCDQRLRNLAEAPRGWPGCYLNLKRGMALEVSA